MIFRYTLAWFPFLLIAIINGAVRSYWYSRYLGDLRAHQVSTLTAAILFGAYVWLLGRRWRFQSAAQPIAVGLIWLVMTIAFEFLFQRYVGGMSWDALFHDYNIFAGRVWALLLLWIAVAPYVFYRLQR